LTLALNIDRSASGEAEGRRGEAIEVKVLPQIHALTGLRFFAAGFILVEHAADWLAQFSDSNVRQYFTFLGIYGMPLFFVLSGFVIHYNYRKLFLSQSIARATCEFAAARFARLFPLYFCLLLVAVCADNLLAEVNGDYTLFAKIMAYYVTLTQSWWYIVYENKLIINWMFSLSWSISTEMFFYVAYVAVIFLILSIRRERTAVMAIVVYSILVMCLFIASKHYLGPILFLAQLHVPAYIPLDDFQNSFYRWLFYFSPYARVFEFFMGCLTAHAFMLTHGRAVKSSEQRYANVILVLVFLSLGMCGLLYLGIFDLGSVNVYVGHLYLNFLCAPAIAFITFYAARYDSWFTRMLSLPSFIALGDASYSIYLLHTWTLRLFNHPAPELNLVWGLEAVLRILCGIGLTLVTAYATYRLIEMPSRAWLRRRIGALIGAAFRDGRGYADGMAAVPKPSLRPPKWLYGAPPRLSFSAATIMLLVTIAIAGELAQSETVWRMVHRLWVGNRSEIEIISATYGMNCKDFPEPAPFRNLVSPGNATAGLRRICDGHLRCDPRVSLALAGDPANGCGKDFSLEYSCSGSAGIRKAYLPGEALGKVLELECESVTSPR
jgi:peptidoglycan/LPS O-acetylase OafA/YrhL